MLTRKLLLFAALLAPPAVARADVKPHPLFTDNMVLQRDVECPVWGLADPGEKIVVSLSPFETGGAAGANHQVTVTADKDGHWLAKLPAQKASTGRTLTISGTNGVQLKNIAFGDVWICSGQSNMEMAVNSCYNPLQVKAQSKNPNIRLFTVQKRTATAPIADQNDLKHFTKWVECGPDTVGGFSAVAYHFGAHLQTNLKVPIGLIHTSWGGTPAEAWTSLEALEAVPQLQHYVNSAKATAKRFATDKKPVNPHTPASLYNAMIRPLLPVAIKGAIWYQGESNAGRAYEYRTLFETMIKDWRKRWGQDFPFFLVQLAPWNAGDTDGVSWAELRETQYLATQDLPKVGMAVITDAGDLFDIHPKDKTTPGVRLALAARAIAYGQKIPYSGPVYKSMKTDGDKAVLTFDHLGGGLVGRYGPGGYNARGKINGFEVCGKDKYFYPATAVIQGDTVVVTCEKVSKPVAVRFGWKNYPVVNLYNKARLPAVPFKTDEFPWTTQPKK
jgi:sialate O-acetylesterase